MTPGSREGIGVDGRRNPSRKPEGCDEEESGDQASEERSTKGDDRVEILNPSPAGLGSGSSPVLPCSPTNRTGLDSNQQQQQPNTTTEATPQCHDQHHFLRSSVRPPSKRIRKDSIGSTINGHGGAKSKGTEADQSKGRVHRGGINTGGGLLTFCSASVCSLFIFRRPCCFLILGHLTTLLAASAPSYSTNL